MVFFHRRKSFSSKVGENRTAVPVKRFHIVALQDAEKSYSEKLKEGKSGNNTLFSAGWTVEELQKLIDDNQKVTVDINVLLGCLENENVDMPSIFDPAQALSNIRQQFAAFVRSIYRHKRTPATHVFVMMISSEQRQTKPYALPIQLIPYASLDETTMRSLICDIIKVMKAHGMKVVGMLTSTNFNSISSDPTL